MKRKLNPQDLLKNKILTNLKVNQNDTIALYFINHLNLEENRYIKQPVLLNIETLEEIIIALPFEPDDFYFDSESIIFKQIISGNTIFWSYRVESDEISELAKIPFEIKTFCFGKSNIFFTAIIQNNNLSDQVKSSTFGPFFEEGVGIVGNQLTGLFKSSLDTRDINLITTLDMDIDQVDYDLQNKNIIFTAFRKTQLKPTASDIYTYHTDNEVLDVFTKGDFRIGYIKSINDNVLIFTGVNLNVKSRNDNQQIFMIDIQQNNISTIGDHLDLSNERPGLATDAVFSTSLPVGRKDEWFYHLRIHPDSEVLYRTNINGLSETINTGLKKIDCFSVINNGILLIGLKDSKLHELYWFDGKQLSQLTRHNQWLDEVQLSIPEKVNMELNHCVFDGWVIKPSQIVSERLYPGVLMIHGGPKMIYSDIFSFDAQILSSKGYFVFYMNPMGSDGRGDAFSNIRGHFGDVPYMQLMAFTDEVMNKYPQLDENRLGVMGGSYGGYMTNYIITHTNRFSAAVSERGISNLMTAFTSSDIGHKYIFEYMGNRDLPWDNPKAYNQASPIWFINDVTTPTLFLHGREDYRCHYTESLNMYGALIQKGVDTKLCLFDGENHGLSVRGRPKSKLKRYEEILFWYQKYLGEENEDGFD